MGSIDDNYNRPQFRFFLEFVQLGFEILPGYCSRYVLPPVNMPGEDGFTLARELREHHAVGIIMLTSASEVVDKVVGLEVGADD